MEEKKPSTIYREVKHKFKQNLKEKELFVMIQSLENTKFFSKLLTSNLSINWEKYRKGYASIKGLRPTHSKQ